MKLKKGDTYYIIRSQIAPTSILCTTNEYHYEKNCGPLGWAAKIYKTRAGAERAAEKFTGTVHEEKR